MLMSVSLFDNMKEENYLSTCGDVFNELTQQLQPRVSSSDTRLGAAFKHTRRRHEGVRAVTVTSTADVCICFHKRSTNEP